jgi:hypothetical protein
VKDKAARKDQEKNRIEKGRKKQPQAGQQKTAKNLTTLPL